MNKKKTREDRDKRKIIDRHVVLARIKRPELMKAYNPEPLANKKPINMIVAKPTTMRDVMATPNTPTCNGCDWKYWYAVRTEIDNPQY